MGRLGKHEFIIFGTIGYMMRWSTAGESHGCRLVAIIEGMPAGIEISTVGLEAELRRRRTGYGRGARQKFEQDSCRIISGVRHGKTLGSPIAIEIDNSEWPRWETVMSPDVVDPAELRKYSGSGDPHELARNKKLTRPRPGHADYAGAIKFRFDDLRNVLERASARETAARVALGYVAKEFLRQVAGIVIAGRVVALGTATAVNKTITLADIQTIEASPVRASDPHSERLFMEQIDHARKTGDTIGGIAEAIAWNVPPALGTYTVWSERLDGQIAQAMMSIPAVKGVEIGDGFANAIREGSIAHDELALEHGMITRESNHAGGIEGGMTNGEPVVVRIAVKPIPTVPHALKTVDLATGEPVAANHQRSDTSAVVPATVIAESMLALTLASAVLERAAGNHLQDIQIHLENLADQHGGFFENELGL